MFLPYLLIANESFCPIDVVRSAYDVLMKCLSRVLCQLFGNLNRR